MSLVSTGQDTFYILIDNSKLSYLFSISMELFLLQAKQLQLSQSFFLERCCSQQIIFVILLWIGSNSIYSGHPKTGLSPPGSISQGQSRVDRIISPSLMAILPLMKCVIDFLG